MLFPQEIYGNHNAQKQTGLGERRSQLSTFAGYFFEEFYKERREQQEN